jgi:hypothetical protein
MLTIDTLSVNKGIFNPNPQDNSGSFGIWDLTRSSIDYNIPELGARKFYIVPDDLSMRPDLISLYQIGDPQYCGSLMKINNISNPFSIEPGRKMFILTEGVIRKTYERKSLDLAKSEKQDNNSPLDTLKKTQEDKKFKVSEGRKKFLEKSIKNKPPLVLPPNVAQPGERKFQRKGRVFTFAPDAGKGGFNRPLKK